MKKEKSHTLGRAPDAESVQRYLRESVRVMRAAADVTGSVEKAIFWFKNNPLATFDYKTPREPVSEGRTEVLIRYIQSLQAVLRDDPEHAFFHGFPGA